VQIATENYMQRKKKVGIDTHAYYPNVNKPQIIDFIKLIGTDVGKERTYDDMEGYSNIDFQFRGEPRSMHMHDVIIDIDKDEARYFNKYKKQHESESWIHVKQDKLPNHTKGTSVSVGYWGSAVMLFTIMACLWGGYIDEQDTDAGGHYKVKKDYRALVRHLFGAK
jgi:hypothetical protein